MAHQLTIPTSNTLRMLNVTPREYSLSLKEVDEEGNSDGPVL